jgi:L-asparaginase II
MSLSVPMIEVWRGNFLESQHNGHAVVCDSEGSIMESWGNPNQVILPRSACKMLQALPLIESGAAEKFKLTSEHLALSCASHQGAFIHTSRVINWLSNLGLNDDAFRCGPHNPNDKKARYELIKSESDPCQYHNNCSGKHCGFLTLNQFLSGEKEYVDYTHPVQSCVREAFESMTETTNLGYAIDGCSAPNFATTLHGLARAMSKMANVKSNSLREKAKTKLVNAMLKHPDLVAGDGRACTELMIAMEGKVAVKTGAEAVFIAIIPSKRMGIAVKIVDGGTRAAEAAITALLIKYGVLDVRNPIAQKWLSGPIKNWRGMITGEMKLSDSFINL